MANDCSNGVTLIGPQPIIDILLYKLKTISREADVLNHRFRFPYIDLKRYPDSYYATEFYDNGDNHFTFTTPWNSDPISMYMMCYALGLQFHMYSMESSAQLYAEYRLTKSGVPEFRELTDEEYDGCNDEYTDEDGIVYANEMSDDARDDLLEAKEWLPYNMDLSLLKKITYEPST